MSIAENLHTVQSNINRVALECGRNPSDIKLVAVSKRFPAPAVEEAVMAGQQLFGENYIQEAQDKIEQLKGTCSFHFIGHLQSNKAKIAASLFDVIETVDSIKLARMLSKELVKLDRTMKILIQVNIGEDEHKSGLAAQETESLIKDINELPNLHVIGLMTMPPFTEDPELARPHFRHLKQLADDLAAKQLFFDNEHVELSMGMSGDYHIAIQEGATIIRIGTAIFGERI